MRCFPSATWPIERNVPAGGITLDNMFLPEGTRVGCQPSVVHQDQTVFGEHTERSFLRDGGTKATRRYDRWTEHTCASGKAKEYVLDSTLRLCS